MVNYVFSNRIDTVGRGDYKEHAGGKFLDSDVNISAGGSWTAGSDLVDVRGARQALLTIYATGANASANGTVTYNFVKVAGNTPASPMSIPTVTTFSLTVAMNGTTKVASAYSIDTSDCAFLKLTSINNGDATYAANACNVEFYFKQGFYL